MEKATWFSTWFDSPYYHQLYASRDDQEAKHFIETLQAYLKIAPGAFVLDAACGKGRHAKMLQRHGMHVEGFDLSPSSIEEANRLANKHLHFFVHDLREPLPKQAYYDVVFNFFTSFGYFDKREDDLRTLTAIKDSLNDYGFAVIDFMNTPQVIANLIPEETKEVDGITFHIKRYVKDGFITKEINFEDQGESYHFTEKVRAFTLEDFQEMMQEVGIYLLDTFGDYKLKKYHKNTSERLIMIFK